MLSISNLHAAYGKVEVLHGISLDVPKGKLVTLIGSNGAGKTTTMRAISGMIKPKGGKVTLDGKDITGHSHKIARAGLAHSPEGRRVFASMSVTDNLLLGAFPRFTRAAEGRHQARPGKSAGTVPAPERTPDAAGRHAVRRRAAMLAMARAVMLNPEVSCWTNRRWAWRRSWWKKSSASSSA
jgi:branched-chain amino acid transport system ATP-binding protein